MRIAVVLPVLNEAAMLPETLRSILGQSRPADRMIIIDGGSTDNSVNLAYSSGAAVLTVPHRGRGGQIAAGVGVCDEDVIVIAHGDMRFPAGALETIQQYLMVHLECPGGCLGHRFDNNRPIYRVIEWWDRRRAMRGYSYGDQAQFFRRNQLDRVGGFPELPLMEDVAVAKQLRRLGRPAYLDVPVTVSARRYERVGWPRVAWRNWLLRRAYRREGDAACWRLYRKYYRCGG